MNTNGRTYTIRTIVRKIKSMQEIDGRRTRGDASRRDVLASAADLASVEGLDGLSIGRLASAAAVSKSGVATLFGTKERLQVATVEAAAQRFRETVLEPARVEPRGIRRIVALLDAWIAYSRDRVFPGGCFFAAAMADFRRVTEDLSVAPQISVEDVAEAARQGFRLIVNNRPDGESPDRLRPGPHYPPPPRKPGPTRRGPHAEPPPVPPQRVRARGKRVERTHG